MKIVFISSLLIPNSIGGVEVLTMLLAKALAKRGHQVIIYTGGQEKNRKEENVLVKEIKELIFSSYLKSFFMPFYSLQLKKRLEEDNDFVRAQIVNAMDLDSILALSGWDKIKGKFVATIQDYGLICPNGTLLYGDRVCPNFCHQGKGFLCLDKRKINFWQKLYLQLAYSFRKRIRDKKILYLTSVVFVSHFVEQEFLKFHDKIESAVIGNCLPQEWWRVKNELPEKDIDLLYAGRLELFKGAEVLLHTIEILLKKKDLKIVFVGGGKINHYKNMAKKLGISQKIDFVGELDFALVKNYYQRAKVVLVPSLWPEPCGRVIIEGMFWGGAVVGSDRGGTPELIIHKKNGFLVAPQDEYKLARIILSLLKNKKIRDRISRQARDYARKNFSPQKIASKYEKFYLLLLSKK